MSLDQFNDRNPPQPEDGIGLALSGGGYRAMVFHVGALIRPQRDGAAEKNEANIERFRRFDHRGHPWHQLDEIRVFHNACAEDYGGVAASHATSSLGHSILPASARFPAPSRSGAGSHATLPTSRAASGRRILRNWAPLRKSPPDQEGVQHLFELVSKIYRCSRFATRDSNIVPPGRALNIESNFVWFFSMSKLNNTSIKRIYIATGYAVTFCGKYQLPRRVGRNHSNCYIFLVFHHSLTNNF